MPATMQRFGVELKSNQQSSSQEDYDKAANVDRAKASIYAWDDDRLQKIEQAFAVSPIVCLSGVTGVGKTTFIKRVLSQRYPIYIGEESIKHWDFCFGKNLLEGC